MKYKVNEDFFKTWSHEMSYIFGYFMADGCMGSINTISFTSKDIDILEKVKKAMGSNYPIRKSHKNKNVFVFSTYRKKIYDSLSDLGGTRCKSLTIKFPHNIPDKYIYDFIRGYFDGDGHVIISKEGGSPDVGFVGTYDFIKNISEILKEKYYINKRITKNNNYYYELRYFGERAQNVLNLFYKNAKIYMDRKYKLYLKAIKWRRKLHYYTKREINIIIDSIKNKKYNADELAFILNRKAKSIQGKAERLGYYIYRYEGDKR